MRRFIVIKDRKGKEEALSIQHIQRIEKEQEGCIVHYLRPFDNIEEERYYDLSVEELTAIVNEVLEETDEKEGNSKNRCPVCEKPIRICKGKFGFFIACSGFPKCTWRTSAEEWMLAKGDPVKWKAQKELKEAAKATQEKEESEGRL